MCNKLYYVLLVSIFFAPSLFSGLTDLETALTYKDETLVYIAVGSYNSRQEDIDNNRLGYLQTFPSFMKQLMVNVKLKKKTKIISIDPMWKEKKFEWGVAGGVKKSSLWRYYRFVEKEVGVSFDDLFYLVPEESNKKMINNEINDYCETVLKNGGVIFLMDAYGYGLKDLGSLQAMLKGNVKKLVPNETYECEYRVNFLTSWLIASPQDFCCGIEEKKRTTFAVWWYSKFSFDDYFYIDQRLGFFSKMQRKAKKNKEILKKKRNVLEKEFLDQIKEECKEQKKYVEMLDKGIKEFEPSIQPLWFEGDEMNTPNKLILEKKLDCRSVALCSANIFPELLFSAEAESDGKIKKLKLKNEIKRFDCFDVGVLE